MTLLWCDGFRRSPNGVYEAVGFNSNSNSAAGRDNGIDSYGLSMDSGISGVTKVVPAAQTMIAGVAYYLWVDTRGVMSFAGGGVTHLTLQVTSAMQVQVLRAGTVLATSAPISASGNEWAYLEMKAKIDDATGTIEVRNYGVPIITLSGVDTRNGGTAAVTDRVSLLTIGHSPSTKYDDFYICDTNGAVNNDFLATTTTNPRVFDLFPNGNGDSVDFTPNTGTNWQAVDDDGSDNDSTYVGGDTVGNKDLYTLNDLAGISGDILGVVQWASWRKDQDTPRSVALVLKSGGVESNGPSVLLTKTYTPSSRALETDPATGAAFSNLAAINAIQIGQKVTL